MATSFKLLSTDDTSFTKTLLHENIPITGSVLSGTYSELNVFNYTHGMFQTVYDYPYASSSANNLMDITIGHSVNSPTYKTTAALNSKKTNVYNELAKLLVGVDSTGSVQRFDEDGLTETAGDKLHNAFFITFSRLLVKDEIKKGTFNLELGLNSGSYGTIFNITGTVSDASGTTQYRTNSPVGEYGILYLKEPSNLYPNTDRKAGLIFYQAGIAVISPSVFAAYSSSIDVTASLSASSRGQLQNPVKMWNLTSSFDTVQDLFVSGGIQTACDSFRTRIKNITFQNTTELNSTIYTLRINNGEFNYSSNPTYLSSSQIRVKNGNPANSAISYITTAGLYSADNELLAVAKLSEPIKKTEDQSLLLRVRLDY